MASSTNLKNPFNVLVMIIGTLFAITACGFCVMTVRDMQPVDRASEASSLLAWMAQYGFSAMMLQLGLLAVVAVAAMATDDYWQDRAKRAKKSPKS